MDFAEPEEHALIREAVRRVVEPFGHSYHVEESRSGGHMEALWAALAASGFVGIGLPERAGGGGLGITGLSIVCEELAAAGCPLLMLVISPGIAGSLIDRWAAPGIRDAWLPRIASGATKVAFAITEPGAGSNSHRLSTFAEAVPGGFVLRGAKQFISGIDEAEAVVVVAATERDEKRGRNRLSLFLVPTDTPGLHWTPLSIEMTAPEQQFAVFFDEVRLPSSSLIGRAGDGLQQMFVGLNPERITVAATLNGIGRYAMARASAYARDRVVWDVPIGAHQGIAHPLAEAMVQLELARLMTAKAAWQVDAGMDAGAAANIAKFAAAEASLACLDRAIQTHGGNGMTTEYGLADLWGITRMLRIVPVTREMLLNHVAEHVLELPRSY